MHLSQFAHSQKIINAIMVSDNGVTEDAKKAKYLIVIKSYADTSFERMEYNFTGPIKRLLTYKDPQLKILHGPYAAFFPSGYISNEGNYVENKKDGSWLLYNDTAKAITESKYHLDTLLAVINLDSLEEKRDKQKDNIDTSGEQEAEYRGGIRKYLNYINKNLKIPDRTQSLATGGTVRVRFIVNVEGKVTHVKLRKSIEFAFDEESMRVISSANDWIPAMQRGKKVNAYREQPITISFK